MNNPTASDEERYAMEDAIEAYREEHDFTQDND